MSSEVLTQSGKARLVVIGGFLGAGKTTAISRFADYLKERSVSVGVITNDYGSELVDSALIRAHGVLAHPVEGGDLCTRLDEWVRVVTRLRSEQRAQVIITEPAGTCVELRQIILASPKRGDGQFSIAPLSVLVDPIRALRVFGIDSGGKLAREITNLYRRQLEEAEIVVINKCDSVPGNKLAVLRDALRETSPKAKVFTVSAKGGDGLDEWFDCLMTKESNVMTYPPPGAGLSSDAEWFLAWLNCMVRVSSVKYFDAGKLLIDLATCLQSLLQQEGGEIAHLKIALTPEQDGSGIAAVSLDRNDATPQLLRDVSEPIQRGELVLNARAYGDPEILHSIVNRALLVLMEHSPDLFARMHHCEHFKAGPKSLLTLARS